MIQGDASPIRSSEAPVAGTQKETQNNATEGVPTKNPPETCRVSKEQRCRQGRERVKREPNAWRIGKSCEEARSWREIPPSIYNHRPSVRPSVRHSLRHGFAIITHDESKARKKLKNTPEYYILALTCEWSVSSRIEEQLLKDIVGTSSPTLYVWTGP